MTPILWPVGPYTSGVWERFSWGPVAIVLQVRLPMADSRQVKERQSSPSTAGNFSTSTISYSLTRRQKYRFRLQSGALDKHLTWAVAAPESRQMERARTTAVYEWFCSPGLP